VRVRREEQIETLQAPSDEEDCVIGFSQRGSVEPIRIKLGDAALIALRKELSKHEATIDKYHGDETKPRQDLTIDMPLLGSIALLNKGEMGEYAEIVFRAEGANVHVTLPRTTSAKLVEGLDSLYRDQAPQSDKATWSHTGPTGAWVRRIDATDTVGRSAVVNVQANARGRTLLCVPATSVELDTKQLSSLCVALGVRLSRILNRGSIPTG